MDVELIIISVPEVPTVRPDIIVLPPLSLNSAKAAVPVADAVADKGTPSSVATLDAMENDGFCNVIVTRTPVAPDRDDVPITNNPLPDCPSTEVPAAVLVAVRAAASLALPALVL
jgi:hypothetical protein